MLRSIHNAFFMVFLVSLAVTCAVSLAQILGIDLASLLTLQQSLNNLRLMLFLAFFFSLFFSRNVGWRIYLPLVLFMCWDLVGYWPVFDLQPGNSLRDLTGSILGMFVGLDSVWQRRRKGGNFWGLWDDRVFAEREDFPWPRLLIFLPLSLGLLSVWFACAMAVALVQSFNRESAGHVRVGWDGVYMQQSIYAKDAQRVYLFAMIHIGDESFYQKVLEQIPAQNSLVLEEGVTDKKGLIKNGLDYSIVADKLKLEPQTRTFSRQLMQQRKTVHADVDVSQFHPQTIELLNSFGLIFSGELPQDQWEKVFGKTSMELLKNDLIGMRNDHLMDVFQVQKDHYSSLIIPWGGLHLKDVAERLMKLGYSREAAVEIKAIDFARWLPGAAAPR